MDVPVIAPPPVDEAAMHQHRLSRLLTEMGQRGVDLLVLTNPVSLRYACGWREYALFQSRIPTYYLYVMADGRLLMHGAYATHHPTIDEFRAADHLNCFDGGLDLEPRADRFAGEIFDMIGAGTVAVERIVPEAVRAVESIGVRVVDAEPMVERARSVKSPEEIVCMRHAIAVAEAAIATMRERMKPGVTENELFAVLHQVNIANDGSWIDGRMLSSGPRTNPWYQEASDRRIAAGELLAFDTDMIGPFGYCADISRTWRVGEGPPSPAQRDRYQRAHAEVSHNAQLLEPGMSFREFSEKAYLQADEFIAHRYACVAHGVGMTDEYPKIYYRQDWERHGYDGVIQADTVMCIESFVGSDRGGPGVKLEDMYLVAAGGSERLSSYPFETEWL